MSHVDADTDTGELQTTINLFTIRKFWKILWKVSGFRRVITKLDENVSKTITVVNDDDDIPNQKEKVATSLKDCHCSREKGEKNADAE